MSKQTKASPDKESITKQSPLAAPEKRAVELTQEECALIVVALQTTADMLAKTQLSAIKRKSTQYASLAVKMNYKYDEFSHAAWWVAK